MAALRLSLLGCAALALCACQPKGATVDMSADQAREVDAIRSAESDRTDQIKERDLEQAADHYAPTAIVAWPGEDLIHGSAQIRAALAESFKDPAYAVELHTDYVKVSRQGDLASAAGGYTLTRTDPVTKQPVTTKGPFVETFAKGSDGRWLIVYGVSSAASPAEAQ
jgi:ketosteroid isomerase-like protein